MEKKISKEMQEKIAELQLLQQRLNLFATQKQTLQLQIADIENALNELGRAEPPIYRLIGGILVEKKPDELEKELKEKKEELDLRVKTLEKQENSTRERMQKLQEEIASKLK